MKDLLKEILDVCSLEGEFLLRSGKISHFYFDKYLLEARPNLLVRVAQEMAEKIHPQTQVLAGLDLGGIPIATALSLETGLPCAFVRKKAKEYGTCQLIEGACIENKQICVLEDVVTTGGQALQSTQQIENLGGHIIQILCVLDRSLDKENKLKKAGYNFDFLFKHSK